MDIVVEKRKNFIINFIYACIFIGLYYWAVKYAMGYVFPFLCAAALAVFLQRPINAIKGKLHIKSHSFVSTVLVLLIVVLIIGVLSLLCYIIAEELKEFLQFLFGQFSSLDALISTAETKIIDIVGKLPVSIKSTVADYVTDLFENLHNGSAAPEEGMSIDFSVLSAPISGAWSVVKGIPSIFLSALVTIISCVFMTADYENIRDLIFGLLSPEKAEKLRVSKRTVSKGVAKLFKAYATLMLITFSEMFLGLYLMKIIGVYKGGYIAIIAFVTCIVDIVPVLGTGTVVIPWAVISLILGNYGLGIALLILYAVITVLRQVIEPKLVANQVGLPAIVTIMAMFLGVKMFGAFGIIILPLSVIIFKLMFDEGIIGHKNAFKQNENGEPAAAPVNDESGAE